MILKPRLFRKPRKGHWSTKGLFGLWLFNEGSGKIVNDLSGNGHTGTEQTDSVWLPGLFGTARDFSGDDFIDIPTTPAIPASPGGVSAIIWVKPDSVTSNFYYNDFSGDNDWAILSGFQDGFYNLVGDGAYPTGTATDSQIPMSGAGIWDCVGWTKNGTNLKGFVNGVEKTSVTISVGDFVPSAGLKIGTRWGGQDKFRGQISHFMFYDCTLSNFEMAQLYREPFIMFERDQIELWVGSVGAAVGANPKGPLGHPLWGALAGPI